MSELEQEGEIVIQITEGPLAKNPRVNGLQGRRSTELHLAGHDGKQLYQWEWQLSCKTRWNNGKDTWRTHLPRNACYAPKSRFSSGRGSRSELKRIRDHLHTSKERHAHVYSIEGA